VSTAPEKPIYSSRAEELELRDAIDEFAIGLAERVDQLQDADFNRDWESLSAQSKTLVEDAKRVGFGPLSRSAEVVAEACESADGELIHKYLCALTDVAKRIRRGHRGAV
jgi:hypothetical protein